jgi:hypothetical protein
MKPKMQTSKIILSKATADRYVDAFLFVGFLGPQFPHHGYLIELRTSYSVLRCPSYYVLRVSVFVGTTFL